MCILKDADLTINLEKCEFFISSLTFLGFVAGVEGLHIDPDQVASMINYPRTSNTSEVKCFVELCSWYSSLIINVSTIVSPLNDFLKRRKNKQQII